MTETEMKQKASEQKNEFYRECYDTFQKKVQENPLRNRMEIVGELCLEKGIKQSTWYLIRRKFMQND